MIKLYTSPTPNGYKISCLLEMLKMPYEFELVNLSENQQFTEKFKLISPNSKIPAIEDTENKLALSESGAIMIYLAEKSGKYLPVGGEERFKALQWLMFQMAHIGPMMGQANVFHRYFPKKIPEAISRYQNECRRLFEVLESELSDNQWLTKDFSIADLAIWCWVRTYKWSGVSIDGLENLQRWLQEIKELPGVRAGLDVPIPVEELKKIVQDQDRIKSSQKIITK
tara:strand:+ start:33760 stop:34437 length:678 start_codon:yes stop_codon:yes gene_type:complete